MMQAAIAVALFCTCAFGVIAPAVARRIAPPAATWMLTIGGLLAALTGIGVLALLAVTVVGQNHEVAAYGHWSIAALRRADPIARPVALVALVLFGLLSVCAAVTLLRRARALRVAYRTCQHLPEHGGIVVLPDIGVDAYALPGRPGRIVVTRGMLRVLGVNERRALLAHERSHLRHGHHWHAAATAVAASLNPSLARLPAASKYAIERWADEDAAREVPRATAAHALLQAAAATAPVRARPRASLAAAGNAVAQRIHALEAGPTRPRPVLLGIAVGTVVIAFVAAVVAAEQTAELFVSAMKATGSGAG